MMRTYRKSWQQKTLTGTLGQKAVSSNHLWSFASPLPNTFCGLTGWIPWNESNRSGKGYIMLGRPPHMLWPFKMSLNEPTAVHYNMSKTSQTTFKRHCWGMLLTNVFVEFLTLTRKKSAKGHKYQMSGPSMLAAAGRLPLRKVTVAPVSLYVGKTTLTPQHYIFPKPSSVFQLCESNWVLCGPEAEHVLLA